MSGGVLRIANQTSSLPGIAVRGTASVLLACDRATAAATRAAWALGSGPDGDEWRSETPKGVRSWALLDRALSLAIRRRDEGPRLWKFLENLLRLAEMIGEQIGRNASDPLRKVDRLVFTRIEADQHAAGLAADIFDGMTVTLRDVGDVALVERLDPVAAVRTRTT